MSTPNSESEDSSYIPTTTTGTSLPTSNQSASYGSSQDRVDQLFVAAAINSYPSSLPKQKVKKQAKGSFQRKNKWNAADSTNGMFLQT